MIPAASLTFGWLKLGERYPSLSRSLCHVTLLSCIASQLSIALVQSSSFSVGVPQTGKIWKEIGKTELPRLSKGLSA